MRIHSLIAVFSLLLAPPVAALEAVPGPVPAAVLDAVDGDTLKVRALIWLGQEVEVAVRIDGIDTPELRGKCAAEKVHALAARDRLAALAGSTVMLRTVRADKYGGRVLAQVVTPDGTDIAGQMVRDGYARPYAGGSRRGWC